MKVVFHPEAEREFLAAVRQYAEMDAALAADFESKIEEATALAASFPDMWREISRGIRRCLVRRFPFGLLYAHDDDVLYVLAVMHLHAKPGYWRSRKKDSPVMPRRRTGRR